LVANGLLSQVARISFQMQRGWRCLQARIAFESHQH
jgi:hypothetical protein